MAVTFFKINKIFRQLNQKKKVISTIEEAMTEFGFIFLMMYYFPSRAIEK